MAQSLRIPVLFKRGTGLTTRFMQRRPFSHSSASCAFQPPRSPTASLLKVKPMARMKQAEQLEKDMLRDRDDLGLLPGTFIMPTGSKCPPMQTKEYWKLIKHRVIKRIKDFLPLIYIKYKNRTPRPKLRLFATGATALGLYKQMYQALAEGDSETIKEICAEGLRDNMLARIHARKPGETLRWKIVEEPWPRVVSSRGTPISGKRFDRWIRQAVVRIESLQKLTRYDKDGKVISDKPARVVVEYLVIQRKTWDGEERPWKIWGTIKETTIEDVEAEEKESSGTWALEDQPAEELAAKKSGKR